MIQQGKKILKLSIRQSKTLAKNILIKVKKIPEEPIFIVGCGHSGTSIMLAMLDSHSQLYGIPYESRIFVNSKSKTDTLYQMLLWSQEAKINEKKRWVEKTPYHIYYLHEIFSIAPKAKVIAMLRDGRDVACSIKARTGNLDHGIQNWLKSCEVLLNYSDNSRVFVVKLEDLVANPENELRKVTSFLGEKYESEMLNYHLVERRYYSKEIKKVEDVSGKNHEIYRTWQINQPLMKNTARYATELKSEEIEQCEEYLHEYLKQFSYI